ncbi:MAG: tyrosine-type recombinase/integrase [Rhodomicrobium sp.]
METRRRKSVKKACKPGQMRPFTPEQISMLEALLKQDGSGTSIRDLALLRVGIDSMLRSSDIVKLTTRDLMHSGEVVTQFAVKQRKTAKVVQCEISDKTRAALADWLATNPHFSSEDRVFAITTRQHQRIVKGWCALLKLDGALYSTHSIRRTKPTHLYAKTKNLAACKELLGHANVSATGVYLGVTGDDARALARQFPI